MFNELIDQINTIEDKILSGDNYSSDIEAFVKDYNSFLPELFSKYMQPEFYDHFADIEGWMEQTKRLNDAISRNDHIYLLDVLCYEIKENLIEASKI